MLKSRHAQNFPAVATEFEGLTNAMSRARSTPSTTVLDLCACDWAPAVARAASALGKASTQDRAFLALQNAYRAHGGLSRLHSLNAGGRVRPEGQGSYVDDLVAAGELFAFHWYDATWIPMFQFALPGRALADGPQRVVAELGRGFDGWALASWFVRPKCQAQEPEPH